MWVEARSVYCFGNVDPIGDDVNPFRGARVEKSRVLLFADGDCVIAIQEVAFVSDQILRLDTVQGFALVRRALVELL